MKTEVSSLDLFKLRVVLAFSASATGCNTKSPIMQTQISQTGILKYLVFDASHLLTAELGDFDPHQNTAGYVSEFCFVPNQTEELERRIAAIHRRLG